MFNADLIGAASDPATHRVERGEILRFANAVGFAHPLYVDEQAARAAGYRGLVAPPTFPIYMRQQPIPGLELPADGRVHGEQAIWWEAPLCAGDLVTYTTRLVDAYVKQGRRGPLGFIVREVEGKADDGKRFFVSRGTTVLPTPVLEAMGEDVGQMTGPANTPRGTAPDTTPDTTPAQPQFELPPLTKPPITRRQLVAYTCASGDLNAIHYDDAAARDAGLPGVVAHGMLTMAFAAQQLATWAGPVGMLQEMHVRFRKPVLPGDALVCRAWLMDRDDHGAMLRFEVAKTAGDVVLTGSARAREGQSREAQV